MVPWVDSLANASLRPRAEGAGSKRLGCRRTCYCTRVNDLVHGTRAMDEQVTKVHFTSPLARCHRHLVSTALARHRCRKLQASMIIGKSTCAHLGRLAKHGSCRQPWPTAQQRLQNTTCVPIAEQHAAAPGQQRLTGRPHLGDRNAACGSTQQTGRKQPNVESGGDSDARHQLSWSESPLGSQSVDRMHTF